MDFEEIYFENPVRSLETMMDNDHFSDHGKYFVMSLPDSENSKFPPRPFFLMNKPRRREKKLVITKFDNVNNRLIPIIKFGSLSGKIAFIENYSYVAYLKESGSLRLHKLPKIKEKYEINSEEKTEELIRKAQELNESESLEFKGITQREIDSFDLNESDELIALTERNKFYVYELEQNWKCSLLMEYEDEVVMTPPILSISFSSDSNFILCRGHQKIVIVDIYGKQKMQQISTLKGIDMYMSPVKNQRKKNEILNKKANFKKELYFPEY